MVSPGEVLKVDRRGVLLEGLRADLLEAQKVAPKVDRMVPRVGQMVRGALLVLKMEGWLQCHP